MSKTSSSLDIYAKVEDLLGVKEAAPELYAYYLLVLQSLEFDSLLDVGCGNGDFLRQMNGAFPQAQMRGIDLSPLMVEQAQAQGVDASTTDLCDINGSYDIVTAVFDMLNYLPPDELASFGNCLRGRLGNSGYFLCDINTEYGFAEVAVGSFIAEDEDRFVAIDSEYADGIYTSDFTLFEREGTHWHKSSETIRQYHYTIEKLAEILQMELVESAPVSLYGDEEDKVFLVFRVQGFIL
jgi:SAM-dependent methyltransferase